MKKKVEEKLIGIVLSDGRLATDYIRTVPKKYQKVITESIKECLRMGYPLNTVEITSKCREIQRKRLAKWQSTLPRRIIYTLLHLPERILDNIKHIS